MIVIASPQGVAIQCLGLASRRARRRKNELESRRSQIRKNELDCHGDARLAMTSVLPRRYAPRNDVGAATPLRASQ
ncbi:hypothetical protein [Rhodocyclus purpureus]|uniref:hypothetical protein n=1 Tax=Rhodocyclus purpureus TaxID=1067 RepID=UPI001914C0D4|nr:hypothetical protein [Rhodocyclus purpureus]